MFLPPFKTFLPSLLNCTGSLHHLYFLFYYFHLFVTVSIFTVVVVVDAVSGSSAGWVEEKEKEDNRS